MSEQEPEVLSPPTEQGDMPDQESSWPKTIGIISLIYAIGGLLCNFPSRLITVVMDKALALRGMEIELPTLVKLTVGALAVVIFVLSLFMLVGSVKLLRRKRSGISILRTWAVFRLVVVLLWLVVSILIAPAIIELKKSIQYQTNEILRDAGQGSRVKKIDDEKLQTAVMRDTVIEAGVFSIYPLFLGFYLSRKKITEEVQTW